MRFLALVTAVRVELMIGLLRSFCRRYTPIAFFADFVFAKFHTSYVSRVTLITPRTPSSFDRSWLN